MLVAVHSVQSSFKESEEGLSTHKSTHTVPMHGMLPKDSSVLKSSQYMTDANLIKDSTRENKVGEQNGEQCKNLHNL